MKFSVLLCVYNSDPDAVVYTLDSIVSQDIGGFEVIICDDGSKDPRRQFYIDYFAERGFKDYKLSLLEKNGGTVRNIIAGLSVAEGKYIKTIGPGDALADSKVLRTVYETMEKDRSVVSYGPMRVFVFDEAGSRVFRDEIKVPGMGGIYAQTEKTGLAKRCMVSYGDGISGAQVFFEADYCRRLMEEVSRTVVYMEDIGIYIPMLEGERFSYIQSPVVLYEGGSGISTSGNSRFAGLLMKDKENFMEYISAKYPDDPSVKLGCRMLAIEQSSGSRPEKLMRKALADPRWLLFRAKVTAKTSLGSLKG